MHRLLDHIKWPSDLRGLSEDQLPLLAEELRAFIIAVVAAKKGHLGASLGVVELTIALHYLFDTPYDLLVWDVGHQAYGHKILTGRKDRFHTNRQREASLDFQRPKVHMTRGWTFFYLHIAALGMAIASFKR